MLKKKYFIENSQQDNNASTKNIVESSDFIIYKNDFNEKNGIPNDLFDVFNNIKPSLEIRLPVSIKIESIYLCQKLNITLFNLTFMVLFI